MIISILFIFTVIFFFYYFTDCEHELCCHLQNGESAPGKGAGFYGDYGKCEYEILSSSCTLKTTQISA